MVDIPDVPNLVLWFSVCSPIIFGLLRIAWGRWLSDIWAKRNKINSKLKAEILVKQYRAALFFVDDDRRFQAASTFMLARLIWGIFLSMIGVALIQINFAAIFIWFEYVMFAIGALIVLAGLVVVNISLGALYRDIVPYTDWVKFHETTLRRIKSLLSEAGLNETEQTKYIDEVVAVADKDILDLEEDVPNYSDSED